MSRASTSDGGISNRQAVTRIQRMLAIALLALLGLMICQEAAMAGPKLWWWHISDDGKMHGVTEEDDGSWWYTRFNADGDIEYTEEIEEVDSNPNPEDPSGGGNGISSKETLNDMFNRLGGGGIAGPSLEQTPLGQYLRNHGIGKGPVYNPADDDNDGGQSPSNSSFYDPKEAAEDLYSGGRVGGGGFNPNGGPIGEQLSSLARRGEKGDGDDDDDAPAAPGGYFGFEMPGPPELVNPAPETGIGLFILLTLIDG